jgi:hypothetical protein
MADSTTIPMIDQTTRLRVVAEDDLNQKLMELRNAHRMLDEIKVPRMSGAHVLSLPSRIAWLNGRLASARVALETRPE